MNRTEKCLFCVNEPDECGEKLDLGECCKGYQRNNLYPVEMSDQAFTKWMKERGWTGDINRVGINYTQFLIEDKVAALVKYRNMTPVDRHIFLNGDFSNETKN